MSSLAVTIIISIAIINVLLIHDITPYEVKGYVLQYKHREKYALLKKCLQIEIFVSLYSKEWTSKEVLF